MSQITEAELQELQELSDKVDQAQAESQGVENSWHWLHRAVEITQNKRDIYAGARLKKLLAKIKELGEQLATKQL